MTVHYRVPPLVLIVLALCLLSGCAFSSVQPETRSITVAASADRALEAGMAMLVDRGFVILHADADLRRVDAARASRPAYEITYRVEQQAGAARVILSGRRGGRPLEPVALDPLLNDISARLGLAP